MGPGGDPDSVAGLGGCGRPGSSWDVPVDSTVARAHQHAAGARTRPQLHSESPGGVSEEPADNALGRSRGGLITKLHLGCEQGQKPLSIVLTAGQRGTARSSSRCWRRIRSRASGRRPRTRPDRVPADKAYTSRKTHRYLRRRKDRGDHPVQGRPGRQPAQAGVEGWPPARLRPAPVQAASCVAMRHPWCTPSRDGLSSRVVSLLTAIRASVIDVARLSMTQPGPCPTVRMGSTTRTERAGNRARQTGHTHHPGHPHTSVRRSCGPPPPPPSNRWIQA